MRRLRQFFILVLSGIMLCGLFLLGGCQEDEVYKFKKLVMEKDDSEFIFTVGQKFEGVVLQEDTFTLVLQEDIAIFRIYAEEKDENGNVVDSNKEVSISEWHKGLNNEIYFYRNYDRYGSVLTIAEKKGNTITFELEDVLITLEK